MDFAALHKMRENKGYFLPKLGQWLVNWKPEVPSSSPAASYVQSWALCSSHQANV